MLSPVTSWPGKARSLRRCWRGRARGPHRLRAHTVLPGPVSRCPPLGVTLRRRARWERHLGDTRQPRLWSQKRRWWPLSGEGPPLGSPTDYGQAALVQQEKDEEQNGVSSQMGQERKQPPVPAKWIHGNNRSRQGAEKQRRGAWAQAPSLGWGVGGVWMGAGGSRWYQVGAGGSRWESWCSRLTSLPWGGVTDGWGWGLSIDGERALRGEVQ